MATPKRDHQWIPFCGNAQRKRFTKGKSSPILVQRMHCVPQHFVSVQYSFPQEFKWHHWSFRKTMHHPRSSRQTTTTSNAYLLSIYSLFLRDSHALMRKCFTMRRDATSTLTYTSSKLCLTIFERLKLSSLTPVTRYGHPCNPSQEISTMTPVTRTW